MHSKINNYLQKTTFNIISKNYRFFININNELSLKYFFWLNSEIFLYENNGFCIKKKKNFFFHMDSFVLFNFLRNMKINQLFFTNSPFIFFIKKKYSDKKNKRVFLL